MGHAVCHAFAAPLRLIFSIVEGRESMPPREHLSAKKK
jgi:hypothetical protein